MRKQQKGKVPEALPVPEMGSSFSGPSTASRHQCQNGGRHTIVHEVDLSNHRPNATTTSCCREALGGERRNSSSAKPGVRMSELLSPEDMFNCCEADHVEPCHALHPHPPMCYAETDDECRLAHDSTPCDCCKTYFQRHSRGGAYVSPRYPQLRQRMLKTLNQRRDHSEEIILDPHRLWPKSDSKPDLNPPVKSIPCGRKENLIIVNHKTQTEDVDDIDDIVRMIEGTKLSSDPRKAAKKARQKEKKIQTKLEEERQKEEEERRQREEEERLQKEKELREEEERRKAEELKRQARKIKKKNRKKRDAANVTNEVESVCSGIEAQPVKPGQKKLALGETLAKEYGAPHPVNRVYGNPISASQHQVVIHDGPVPDNATATDDGTKPRMVTIRRHPPNAENQNVVTITVNDERDDYPVYMLVNGQLFMSEIQPTAIKDEEPKIQTEDTTTSIRKKKKKKKKRNHDTMDEEDEQYITGNEQVAAVPNVQEFRTSHYGTDYEEDDDTVDLGALNLPPGITITKVPSLIGKCDFNKQTASHMSNDRGNSISKESFSTSNNVSRSGIDSTYSIVESRKYVHHVSNEEDIFCRTENEEFEEVISRKTFRKRVKAAKSKEMDGIVEDLESIRASPPVGGTPINHSRRPQACDKLAVNGSSKWTSGKKTGKSKSNRANPKSSTGFVEKTNQPHPSSRQNQPYRNNENFHHGCSSSSAAAVMPRLSRPQKKNGHNQSWTSQESDQTRLRSEPQAHSPQILDSSVSPRDHFGVPHGNTVQYRRDYSNSSSNDVPNLQMGGHSRLSNVNANQPVSQPVMKLWDHGEIKAPPLGPFTIQAENPDDSWNPWKDWSEHSTPENPSPRFGLESRDCNPIQEAPSKNYSFHELMRKAAGKSPIQRPVPGNPDATEGGINNRDMFYPHMANGFEYDSGKYYMQKAPAPGSHTNASDVNLKCSPQPQNSLHKESKPHRTVLTNDASYFQPVCNTYFRKVDEVPAMYNMKMASNPEESSWNSYKAGSQETFLQRRPSDKSEFLLTQALLNSPATNDQKWSNYSGNCSPIHESSDIMYNHGYSLDLPSDLHSTSHDMFKNSWSNISPGEIAMRSQSVKKPPYNEQKLSPSNSEWPIQGSPRVLHNAFSQPGNWDSSNNIHFCPDFAGGAHH